MPCLTDIAPDHRLIVALDVSSAPDAQQIVKTLGDSVHIYKVGMQLFTAEGPKVVRDLVSSGHQVFLDLKYHDIPNTVAAAVREAVQLGVSMLTVHASGGKKMLEAAAQAARAVGSGTGPRQNRPRILAVTILTSMDEPDMNQTGVSGKLVDQVIRLTSTALESGCDGVVSSAHETPMLRAKFGDEFLIVNPGVRPAGADAGDQARIVTPAQAITNGASQIVVGRPITAAKDPFEAATEIQQEIKAAALQLIYDSAVRPT